MTAVRSTFYGADAALVQQSYDQWRATDPSRTATIGVWAHDITLTAIKANETAGKNDDGYMAPSVPLAASGSTFTIETSWGTSTLARFDIARTHTIGMPARSKYQAEQVVAWCRAHRPAETWGPHLGLNLAAGDTTEVEIDRVAALDLGWVVLPREHGWGDDDSGALISHAHSVGLKVLVTVQEHGGGTVTPKVHDYDFFDGTSGQSKFVDWCAHWVGLGADAIQIGNEWNNVGVFWNGSSRTDMADRALLHQLAAAAVRAKSATIPIVSCGWSPASAPYDPPTVTKNLFAARPWSTFARYVTGVGHHPYNWRSWPDEVLTDGSGTKRFDWNACAQAPMVYEAGGRKPLWFSEYGGPSGGVTGTMTGGVKFSEDTQGTLFERYHIAFNGHLKAGVQIEMAAAFPVRDATGGEDAFGVYRKDGSLKPAGKALRDFAKTARPAAV